MKFIKYIPILIILVIAAAFSGVFYTVDVTEQAILLYFGKPVKVIKEPGLQMRIPVAHTVIKLSKMLQEYDAPPSDIITKDKKNLVVDNYCRWKIHDPLKFYKSVRDVYGAFSRLDDIIYSEMRIELGQHTLSEVISENRNEIMKNVTNLSRVKAKEYGIEIVDIRIKRADLPEENEKAVFARMRAERSRIAKQYRSEGLEEAQKIKAKTEKERTIILANAYKKVQEIKGKTDALVINEYAQAYNQDKDFYEFSRSLQVYEEILNNKTNYFLTTDTKLLKMIKQGSK
jgi:membrane protease subunit HflC